MLGYDTCLLTTHNILQSYSEGDGRSAVHKETEPALERQVPSLQDSTVEGQAVDLQKSLLTKKSTDKCEFDV